MSDRVIVTSGLSKAYGIPGVRIGWIVGRRRWSSDCWSQHDYLTIGPNKLSDRLAQIAVQPENRERCYARTREILRQNLPIAREWIGGFGGRLTWREPQAGAIALVKYDADVPSVEVAERVRLRQSTLIVPGEHVGLEGHLRVWLGGREAFLREGLRRIGEELRAAVRLRPVNLSASASVSRGKEPPDLMPQTSVRAAALLILLAGGAFVSETYGQTPERRTAQPEPAQPRSRPRDRCPGRRRADDPAAS